MSEQGMDPRHTVPAGLPRVRDSRCGYAGCLGVTSLPEREMTTVLKRRR